MIKKLLMGLFLKLSAKVRYAFYLFLLALGAYVQLRRMIVKAEKQQALKQDARQGLKMWEKKDEIERKVELMGDADMAKWMRSNKEWFYKP